MSEISGEVAQAMYKYLTSPKAGVKNPTAVKVARLAAYMTGEVKLTKAEIAKWKSLQVMNEKGRVKMVDPESGVEWIMISLVYDGILKSAPAEATA